MSGRLICCGRREQCRHLRGAKGAQLAAGFRLPIPTSGQGCVERRIVRDQATPHRAVERNDQHPACEAHGRSLQRLGASQQRRVAVIDRRGGQSRQCDLSENAADQSGHPTIATDGDLRVFAARREFVDEATEPTGRAESLGIAHSTALDQFGHARRMGARRALAREVLRPGPAALAPTCLPRRAGLGFHLAYRTHGDRSFPLR